MEPTAVTPKSGNKNNKTLIGVAVIAIIVAVAAVAFALSSSQKEEEDSGRIGYSSEATVMLDQDSLQSAFDEAMENAKNGSVALNYIDNAYSEDGIHFDCYIANSQANALDMFLTIYADLEMKDQLYLSELVPPGSGFETLTLDHALEVGDHTVYVVVTQVSDDENGEQVVRNQVIHTMEFHVGES